KRSARNIAINVTPIARIFSVHFIIISIWAKSLICAIILFMILSAIIFTFLYWKFANEIVYRKIFSRYWRLNFLFFSFVYLILLLYGLGSRIFEAVQIYKLVQVILFVFLIVLYQPLGNEERKNGL